MTKSIKALFEVLPQVGRVEWIGIRPEKRKPLEVVKSVEANTKQGLVGDHYRGSNGKRQVTLIQAEHLEAVASMLGKDVVDPLLLRRNIVVRGINLLALKEKRFQVGGAVLEMTGLCHPCSRMEQNLGAGGYNAVRGHGGITARVLERGKVAVGDEVKKV